MIVPNGEHGVEAEYAVVRPLRHLVARLRSVLVQLVCWHASCDVYTVRVVRTGEEVALRRDEFSLWYPS